MGKTISKTLIFNIDMSKLAQILETVYKQAWNWELYNFWKMIILHVDLGADFG